MNIFQVKCEDQGLDIDLLKENRIELNNVDKYVRNIVNELKLNGERNKNILLELQEEVKENYENIRKLNEKFQEIKSSEIESKSTKSKMEKEFDILKLDGERKQKELERKCAEQTGKIDLLNEEIVKLRNVDKCMIEQLDNLKLDGERNKKDLMRNEIDEMRKKQIEMRTMSNRIDQTVENIENKLLKIEINQNKMNYGEFVWRIDKINDKMKDAKNGINTDIYSDSFYTHKHGYKMCLCVCPDGDGVVEGTHLSVFFCLMKGEFDDILQWPFKYDVTFSLVNQQTRIDHVSKTVKYDNFPNDKNWNKPINERNDESFGYSKFIELKELSTNTNLILNNQIFIKCSVNISS